jgi:hypothetical protein
LLRQKTILAGAFAAVLMLLGVSSASAADTSPHANGKGSMVSTDKRTDAEIAARDNQIRQIIRPALYGDKDLTRLNKELERIGVVGFKDLTAGSFSPLSYSTSLEQNLYSYYDSQVRQQNVVGTFWFKDDAVLQDANCSWGPQLPCEVGGEEVFGFSFSKDLPVVGYSAYRCSFVDGRDCSAVDGPYEVSQKGVAWKMQDVVYGQDSRYNMRAGDFYFRTQDICDFQAFTSYTHTWGNAEISEVNIGWGSLGVVVANANNSWTKSMAGSASNC